MFEMMDFKRIHNKKFTRRAKELRKNMTPHERKLWYKYLRAYPVRILKQKVVNNYIVDFYCRKANLVIEIDGSQHYEDDAIEYDNIRLNILNEYGLKVIRFTNKDIESNFSSVCERIDQVTKERIRSQSSKLL